MAIRSRAQCVAQTLLSIMCSERQTSRSNLQSHWPIIAPAGEEEEEEEEERTTLKEVQARADRGAIH